MAKLKRENQQLHVQTEADASAKESMRAEIEGLMREMNAVKEENVRVKEEIGETRGILQSNDSFKMLE